MKKQKETRPVLPREEWPYEVPENWVWTRMGNMTSITGGGTPSSSVKEYYENGTIPWISPADLSDYNEIYISHGKKMITPLGLEKSSARMLPKDTVCLSTRAPIGYVAIAATDLCTNQGFKSFLPAKCYDAKYLYWFLKGNKEMLEANASGTTFLELSTKRAGMIQLPLPPLPEQQRIVARIESFFSKLDAAAEKIRTALEQFPIRKAALLHKAFTGELTKKWREEHGVGMDSWKHETLCKTDLKIIDGDRGKNYPKREELSDTGYCLFLNAKNVTKNGFSFNDVQFISSEKNSLLRAGKLERGDIVLTTRGTIGNIAYYDESIPYHNVRINSGMVIYRGGTQFEKPFLIWFFKSEDLSRQIANLKTGTAQPQLPIKIMNNLLLPIPPIDEQQEIVRRLDAILAREQTAKETAERLLTRIALTKKSILARAFRGLLGTNDPKEESAEGLLNNIMEI